MRALLASKGIGDDEHMHCYEMIAMIMALRETSKLAEAKAATHRAEEEEDEEEEEEDDDAGFPDPVD